MASALTNLSNELAAAVESAGRSVVGVSARRGHPASGIVWSADGVIVTAHHVVQRNEDITVTLPDGRAVAATLAGRDPSTDLAVLRAQASGLTVPSWAQPPAVQVGHVVLALGRPGDSIMATLGIVSALGEGWRTPAGGKISQYLQTDVVMYPGFSGGALVGAAGALLGMNTSGLLRGISIAVPAAGLAQVVEAILTRGGVRRGYLGVGAQPVRLPEALARQLGQETGLLLVGVEPGSPAERGGLLMGDTLVTIDGQPLRHLDDLLDYLGADRIGSAAQVRVVRAGQMSEQTVTIGEHA